MTIVAEDGHTVWTLKGYEFGTSRAASQHQPQPLAHGPARTLNNGLFQVTDRIYQVRGFDVSNMTIIEGDTGDSDQPAEHG